MLAHTYSYVAMHICMYVATLHVMNIRMCIILISVHLEFNYIMTSPLNCESKDS